MASNVQKRLIDEDDMGYFIIELTQAEYDALSDAEKNNGKVYFITDGASGASSGIVPIVECTQAVYDALSDIDKLDGKIYFITDSGKEVLHTPEIINTMNPLGEIELIDLPKSGTTGDYYYILDKYEGRYYDGSTWRIVR